MAESNPDTVQPKPRSLIENWISLAGAILAASSFFAVLCLIAMDFFAEFSNPYMGILTYVVAPTFLILGLTLIIVGVALQWRHRHRLAPADQPRHLRIDLNIPGHRKALLIVSVVTFVFLVMTAVGSYRTYHFTESVTFCGKTCHTVMKPEFTAYQNSPHARVTCVQCHIGPGAGWFVKSKLSGSYQVYSVLAHKYPQPIPTPIKNLRPAQETCEQCHWPQKFYGSAERLNTHFQADESNTVWTIRLLMKIGGGDPTHGPVGGIHWHMNIGSKVEYIAADETRQKIPWVRITGKDGKVTLYETSEADEKLKPEQVTEGAMRRMDCIDCHNRPSHVYNPPAKAVNIALATGRIDPKIPFIKKKAVEALIKEYQTTDEALTAIEQSLTKFYATEQGEYGKQNPAEVQQAIDELKKIYTSNFFPEMKVTWRVYPSNIGHTIFPGCYRCHDGKHVSEDGKKISHDCNSCHTIIAQGSGMEATSLSPQGLEFKHPVDIAEMWKEMNCAECHTGALVE